MQNVRTYDTAGTSNLNGTVKPRFANGTGQRFRTLVKNNHTDVCLKSTVIQDKNNALRFLLNDEEFAEQKAEIEEYAQRNSKQLRWEIEGKQTCTALAVAGPLYCGIID